MIKLEITDPHLLDKKALQETAIYLMALSGGKLVIPPGIPSDEEMTAGLQAKAQELADRHAAKKPYVAPALTPLSIDDQLDMQQLAGTSGDIDIEEELIPVPAESVCLHAPTAAEVFNPVNSLNLPAAPKPNVELDTEGLPWDLRIHARTKTKMKDGSWKKLRGVGPEVVKRVEAELKAVQNIPAPPVSVSVPVPPVTANAVVPAAPAVPGFTDLMSLVTKSITEGRLKREQVVEVLKPFGIPSLPLVSTRLDLIPAIMVALEGVINAPR